MRTPRRSLVLLSVVSTLMAQIASATTAADLYRTTGVKGGLVIHIGADGSGLTTALRASDSFMVHGLALSQSDLAKARDAIDNAGLYGPVSADLLTGPGLPYGDNLANLIVVEKGAVPRTEVMRVLAPNGVCCVHEDGKWIATTKPRPADMDEWTHYLYDGSNNAVSHDRLVEPPRHVQWIGSPRWTRNHDRMSSMSALVAAQGRIFYIMDEGSRASILLPPRWKLVGRDAFNGTILWKRDIPEWHFHLWPLKSGPAQLPRRLAAVGDRVYVTLGLKTPLAVLDAASGTTLLSVPRTENTEEIIVDDGVIYCLVNPKPERPPFVPDRTGTWNDTRRVAKEITWNQQKQRVIVAADAATGNTLWTREDEIAPLTMTVYGQQVVYYNGEQVIALNRRTGELLWKSGPVASRKTFNDAFAPTLVAYDDVILYAGGDSKMTALSAADGKVLWSAPHHPSGHSSPRDLLVVQGLAWSGAIANGTLSGVFTGHDLHSGEVKKEFEPDVETYWFHHRCHRSKATDRFILTSRTGIEFVDPKAEHWEINHWVRGACIYGIMPANGLIYAPPHSCACYLESKQFGFNALAPSTPSRRIPDVRPERLTKGPAYGYREPVAESANDWPAYRHDHGRSGATSARVAPAVTQVWQTDIKGKLTSLVAAGGRVLVAAVDRHTLYALDADTGKQNWTFTAGGRIDSPPTLSRGLAIFGCRDGYVYALRASDGALSYRFRAAPVDRRIMAYEQLESVWPVNGSVLVQDGVATFVAGRSMFLDAGLRMIRLDAVSGELLSEEILDSRLPDKDGDIQSQVKVLNMPVALPDILSSDGKSLYMRSQQFDLTGKRSQATPLPTDPLSLSQAQQGEDRHLFCPVGYIDDTWFHRSYWMYGRRYSSGCNWWHRAGQFTPAGRIMVYTDTSAYGYGRRQEYFVWSVPLDYHLFGCNRDPVTADGPSANPGTIAVDRSDSLSPRETPLTVSAWVLPKEGTGVVLARGGASHGYALTCRDGKPRFLTRVGNTLTMAEGNESVTDRWVHLAGVITEDGTMTLYVDGKPEAITKAPGLIKADPNEIMQIGRDDGSPVGDYDESPYFHGTIDDVRIYKRALSAAEVSSAMGPDPVDKKTLVLHFPFDEGDARDSSGNGNTGGVGAGVRVAEGKLGDAMAFSGASGDTTAQTGPKGNAAFRSLWSETIPIHARALVLADDTLFVAGPPDVLDEEALFQRPHDENLQQIATQQEAALNSETGGLLLAVNRRTGKELSRLKLSSPPRWDAMIATPGRLFMATETGTVICYSDKE